MSIHVAIDAFRLVGPPTSIGTYTLELTAALVAEGCILTFLLPRDEPSQFLDQARQSHPEARFVISPKPEFPEQSSGRLFHWNQITIPALLKHSRPECLISIYHQTPLRIPKGIARIAIIHDCCGLRADCGYRPLRRAWFMHWSNLKSAQFAADVILPISQATHDAYLKAFPAAAERLHQPIYNRVSTANLDPIEAAKNLQTLDLQPASYILGFGLAGKRKGTDVALRAYSAYRKQGGQLPLVLIAAKDIDLEAWGLDRDLVDEVLLLGRIDDKLRDSLYAGASSFLFFSRCEGFGYPLVEAARQGCPSIAWQQTTADEIFQGVIPLLNQLDPEEGARMIRHYEALSPTVRDTLKVELIKRSMDFNGDDTGSAFMAVIRSAIAHNIR